MTTRWGSRKWVMMWTNGISGRRKARRHPAPGTALPCIDFVQTPYQMDNFPLKIHAITVDFHRHTLIVGNRVLFTVFCFTEHKYYNIYRAERPTHPTLLTVNGQLSKDLLENKHSFSFPFVRICFKSMAEIAYHPIR